MAQPRAFEEVRLLLTLRAQHATNPFADGADPGLIAATLDNLHSVEPQAWVEAFSALAEPHQAAAATAERSGDSKTAAENYLRAYQYWRVARYPAPNSVAKREAYRASQQMYLKAG
jgi:hypothetical protein